MRPLARRRIILAAFGGGVVLCAGGVAFAQPQAAGVVAYETQGDSAPAPLSGLKGDAARGRAIVVDRQKGLCLLCHSGPFPEQRFQGDIAPSLEGAGARWSEGQLRLRMIDATRLNPATSMPSYHRTEGLARVAPAFRDKPILDAQEIEDVVAFLTTLREPTAAQEKP
jgi:sulfur-oxidizing protein SoxX